MEINSTIGITPEIISTSKRYDKDEHNYLTSSIELTGDTSHSDDIVDDIKSGRFALLFPNVTSIMVPTKAEYNLRKYVSKPLLREIDEDINVAVEKCLLVLSNLSSTYFREEGEEKWKQLSSIILHKQTLKGNDTRFIYKKILDILIKGTTTGPFIEVKKNNTGGETYSQGNYCKSYRLTDNYLKGIVEYNLTSSEIIQKRNKSYYEQINKANDNIIASNLLKTYPKIDLPTEKEILAEAKRLVKIGYITKKGKKLTFRYRHKNHFWKDADKRSFVEDSIELYNFLTKRGFMIPVIGDGITGGRVVDSFTLMPSWIRNLIKIDGQKVVECDYKALHPNIAISVYGGTDEHISHEKVSEALDMPLNQVKKEHLSFFNKPVNQMRGSKIYNYYKMNQPNMLNNIEVDKSSSKLGYKITTNKLFKAEVNLMTDVIRTLNVLNITVGYVYDSLITTEKNKILVQSIMNRIAIKHNINTYSN